MTVSTHSSTAIKLLHTSKKAWFISLLLAQLVFVTYLALGYGISTLKTNIVDWNKFNQTAYVADDALGNTMYGLHVLLAIIMIIGGSLQLIPQIRDNFTRFHRINGRVFVSLACTISLAGLYLITNRGTVGNLLMHSLTATSGLIVLITSFFVVSTAKKRRFSQHRAWAIRLFLAANGVLFFRLIMFAWLLTFGTLGINTEDFTGPTVVSISVASYILPFVIFEWLSWAERSRSRLHCYFSSAMLSLISLVFLLGLFGITMGRWYPALQTS